MKNKRRYTKLMGTDKGRLYAKPGLDKWETIAQFNEDTRLLEVSKGFTAKLLKAKDGRQYIEFDRST